MFGEINYADEEKCRLKNNLKTQAKHIKNLAAHFEGYIPNIRRARVHCTTEYYDTENKKGSMEDRLIKREQKISAIAADLRAVADKINAEADSVDVSSVTYSNWCRRNGIWIVN